MKSVRTFAALFCCVALACVLAGCNSEDPPADSGQPGSTAAGTAGESGRADSSQEEIVDVFLKYCQACQDGDLETYRKLMCTAKLKRLEEILAESGQTLQPKHIGSPQLALADPSKWTVTHFRRQGEHARLQLLINDASGLELDQAETDAAVALAVFIKEAEGWKLFSRQRHHPLGQILRRRSGLPALRATSILLM